MTDTLIYADFLPDSDAILHVPILSVLKSSLEKELLGDEDAEHAQAQLLQPEEQEKEEEEEEVSNDTTPDDSSEEDEADLAEGEGDQDGDESEDEDEDNIPAAPQPDDDESAAPGQPLEAEDNEEQEEEEGVEQVGAEEAENQQDEPKQEHDSDASYVASSIADSSSPRDRQSAAAKEARRRLDLLSFVDFNIVCVRKRRPSNTNKSPESRNIAGEEEEEEEDDDEVLEDVKLPPVRVRLVRQKPLCDREILSSLFDAAEKQEQERNRRKGSREKASTATATTTTTSSRSLIHQIADSVRSASLYMLAYSVQYLVIQFLLIVFFKEVYIKRLRH